MASLIEQRNATKPLSVTQQVGAASKRSLSDVDQLLLILPNRIRSADWRGVPEAKKVKALLRKAKDKNAIVSTRLNNDRQTAMHISRATTDSDTFALLTLGRKLVAATSTEKAGKVGILVIGFDDDREANILQCVTAAALAAAFVMPNFKSEKTPANLRSIKLLGLKEKLDLSRVLAEARGNNTARWLTSLPANKLSAESYAKLLEKLAADHGWHFKKYGIKELEKLGAGAFLAVAQGNEDDSASIIRLQYRPADKKAAGTRARASSAPVDLSLVGKGIIFDTGGTNLKPFTSMLDMHIDMGGSGVALGTLQAIAALELPLNVDCWLAITENRTGPAAYKSQDVVTALNGKTIQVIHTDAEGRMVLADTLALSARSEPRTIIDFATLTGACMNAVTTRYSGAFTNVAELHPVLKRAGRNSGERVWPFPIGDEFLEELSSKVADVKQCSPDGGGDHILAASFLNEFVPDNCRWIHIDLSACSRKGGLGHVPTTLTGFGIRYAMNLIVNERIADADDATE